jgi:DHA2 family multidrug resistance protein-like MFS transporter
VLSVVTAFAASPLMLIVTRALLGVAGATLAPSTLALITSMFRDERRRGKAIAIWATCQFAGGALGPVLAGVLLQYFWWGSVFLVSVPAMALLLIAGPVLLPEFRGEFAGRLEGASIVMSLAAVLLTIYGIKQLAIGTAPLVAAIALIAGPAAGAVFARLQHHVQDYDVVGVLGRLPQPVDAVVRRVHDIPFAGQPPAQRSGHVRLVLNKQQPH